MSVFIGAYSLYEWLLMFGAKLTVSFIGSMILISFPCTVIEAIFKTKIPEKVHDTLVKIGTITLLCYFLFFA